MGRGPEKKLFERGVKSWKGAREIAVGEREREVRFGRRRRGRRGPERLQL